MEIRHIAIKNALNR